MIAHSSFCNESVVISYGIVAAKIQLLFELQKKMTEKYKINPRKWQLHTFAITFNNFLKQDEV